MSIDYDMTSHHFVDIFSSLIDLTFNEFKLKSVLKLSAFYYENNKKTTTGSY